VDATQADNAAAPGFAARAREGAAAAAYGVACTTTASSQRRSEMLFESLEGRRLFAVNPAGVEPAPGPNEHANPVGALSAAAGAENGETASAQGKAGTRGATMSALAGGGAD
jgi:hypothetical protein